MAAVSLKVAKAGDCGSCRQSVSTALAILYLIFLGFITFRPSWIYYEQSVGFLPSLNFAGILVLLLVGLYAVWSVSGGVDSTRAHWLSWFTIVLLLYGAGIAVAHAPVGLSVDFLEYLQLYAVTIVYSLLLLLFGLGSAHLVPRMRDGGTLRRVTIVAFILLLTALLSGVGLRYLRSPGVVFPGIYQRADAQLAYLAISDAMAVASLLMLTLCHRFGRFVLVGLGAMVVLVATYSRAALGCFLLAMFLMCWLRFGTVRTLLAFSVLVIIPAFALWLGLGGGGDLEAWRMARPLVDPGSDPSLQSRASLLETGIERLGDHWFLGMFGAEIVHGSGAGTYIHNLLSYWESYGILFFGLLVFLIGISAAQVIKLSMYVADSPAFALPVGLFAYAMVAVFVARSYAWPYLWLALGTVQSYWMVSRARMSR